MRRIVIILAALVVISIGSVDAAPVCSDQPDGLDNAFTYRDLTGRVVYMYVPSDAWQPWCVSACAVRAFKACRAQEGGYVIQSGVVNATVFGGGVCRATCGTVAGTMTIDMSCGGDRPPKWGMV